jgi:hypothetical protein
VHRRACGSADDSESLGSQHDPGGRRHPAEESEAALVDAQGAQRVGGCARADACGVEGTIP